MLLTGAAFVPVFFFLVPGAVVILVPSLGMLVIESVRVGAALLVLVETFLSVAEFILVAGGVFWFCLVLAGLVVCAKAGRQLKAKNKAITFNFILFITDFL